MNGSGTGMSPISRPGRVAAIGLLLLALWNPSLPLGTPPLDLILLLDESSSMERVFTDRSWQETVRLATHLPEGSRFSLIRFGGTTATEIADRSIEAISDGDLLKRRSPPRTRGIDPNSTHIEQAIRAALMRSTPGRPTSIVLVSDGLETEGALEAALGQAPGSNLRIYWFHPDDRQRDAWIRVLSLGVPEQIMTGQTPSLSVEMTGDGTDRGRLELKLDGVPFSDREIRFSGTAPVHLAARLPPTAAGIHLIEARASLPGTTLGPDSRRYATIHTIGPARILYLGMRPDVSPVVTDLREGGWPLTSVSPSGFHPGLLDSVDVIIIEDLPVIALPDRAWQRINEAVTRQGKGLLVLGGPHSFGAGGYRDSVLERLLPVVAESRLPLDPAAVLFLLDKSGSMERKSTPDGESRMAIARQAVLESARLLQREDRMGLIAFDTESRTLLPLAIHHDIAERITQSRQLVPHGGTRVAPALEAAIEELDKVDIEQRLILLITDGFIEENQDFSGIAELLKQKEIDLVALTIGPRQENPVLQRLTDINNGRLLPVVEVIRLPRLMRDEMLKRRSAVEQGPVQPMIRDRIEFLPAQAAPWPPLTGYAVTRPKPGTRLHLVSEKGDPLLASRFAGAGRVIVLPAGLDRWASQWRDWDYWGLLLGGLVEWSNGNRNDPLLSLKHQQTPAGTELIIDAMADDPSGWDQSAALEIQIRNPGGVVTRPNPELIAPGRYRALLPPLSEGLFRIRVVLGSHSQQGGFYHQPVSELNQGGDRPSAIETALKTGVVEPWQPGMSLEPGEEGRGALKLRRPLLILALLVYLITLIAEREISFPFSKKRHQKRR